MFSRKASFLIPQMRMFATMTRRGQVQNVRHLVEYHLKPLLTPGQISLFTDIGSKETYGAKELLLTYNLPFTEFVLQFVDGPTLKRALVHHTRQKEEPYVFFGEKFIGSYKQLK